MRCPFPGECDTFKCIQQWSAWSASCGLVTRTLRFVKVPIKVKKESCEGLETTCPNVTETQTDDLFCKFNEGLDLDSSDHNFVVQKIES